MSDFEIASGSDAIARLQPLWREADAFGTMGAFGEFDFVRASARLAEVRGAVPLVAVFRRHSRACSLLPLRSERLFGVRAAVPLLSPLAQYTDVIGAALSAEDLAQLCTLLRREGTDVVLLRKTRQDSGLHDSLSQLAQSQRAGDVAHYIDLSAFGTFAAYDASFSSRTRRSRRQRLQRLEAQAGPVTFEVLRNGDAIEAFDIALQWKRAWLARRGLSSPVFDSGGWEYLLREIVAAGRAIVTALKAGSVPIAVEVGFQERTSYVSYLGAYDETTSRFSPGQEQMLRTVEWCFGQGFDRYDLLAPSDDYKRHWTRTGTGVPIDDYAIALTPLGRGVTELRRHVRPIARDLYFRLPPEVRIAGGRYAIPAATMAAAAAAAGAMMGAIE